MQEIRVRFLGWEDLLEKGMATHSSVLAWRILRDRGAGGGGLQSIGLESLTRLSDLAHSPVAPSEFLKNV